MQVLYLYLQILLRAQFQFFYPLNVQLILLCPIFQSIAHYSNLPFEWVYHILVKKQRKLEQLCTGPYCQDCHKENVSRGTGLLKFRLMQGVHLQICSLLSVCIGKYLLNHILAIILSQNLDNDNKRRTLVIWSQNFDFFPPLVSYAV